ncbi:MAG: bifunctional homocysteine S-methyltransferase/methylenetetrahydrofolate reductase [Acidobacteria bacterium]|nr:MAG: bifunctional homocysteine S-methyltransferase/methylenetetrahydrofolate reductase [Acidobacteriota bacterium]
MLLIPGSAGAADAPLPPLVERLRQGVLLFDGGIGTEIYGRGVFLNVCYEELNLSRPELVEEVHRAFLLAGADAIETNTFGASAPRLEAHGLADRLREINAAAVRIARRAANGTAYVAGAVGPLGIRLEPWGPTSVDEAVALFRQQVEALAEAGVDLVSLETFSDLVEIQAAIRACREVDPSLPVLAMMTVDEEGRTPEGVPPEWLGRKLDETDAEVIGVNCSVGPASMLPVVEAMAAVTERPLAAMPNAGIPRTVDGRMHYLTSPVYMARYVRRFVQAGARVVGGCCGVTPEHIRAMRAVLAGSAGEQRARPRIVVAAPRGTPHPPVPAEQRSRLARKVAEGRFVTIVEAPPPRGYDAGRVLENVSRLAAAGVDAVLVPDDPRVTLRMSPLSLALLIVRQTAGGSGRAGTLEPVLQYSCRDRSLLGMQSDLLGAHALGLRNVMPITGNAPRPGQPVWSPATFDVDAIGLTNVIARLNRGLDVGDTPIGGQTRFFTAANATVGAPNLDEEIDRLWWKVDAGAEIAVSTPVFSREALARFLERIAAFRVPFVAGIWPVSDLREAEHLAGEVPGIDVPHAVLDRLARFDDPADQAREGLAIAREVLEAVRPLVEGVYVAGHHDAARALELLDGVVGRAVDERRTFPGRPGIRSGGPDAG